MSSFTCNTSQNIDKKVEYTVTKLSHRWTGRKRKAQVPCSEDSLDFIFLQLLSNPDLESFMEDYLKLINCKMDQDRLLENYEFVSDYLASYWMFFIEFPFRKRISEKYKMLSAILVHTILDNSKEVVLILLSNVMVAAEHWQLFSLKKPFQSLFYYKYSKSPNLIA